MWAFWQRICDLQCVAVCCSVLQRVAACCSFVSSNGSPRDRWGLFRRRISAWDALSLWSASPGVLQYFGVCCSVLQCVTVCCCSAWDALSLWSPCVLQCVTLFLKCVAVCYSVLQCAVAVPGKPSPYGQHHHVCCSVLQWVAVCCSVLQCVAVCCSVLLQCLGCPLPMVSITRSVALCCSVLQ